MRLATHRCFGFLTVAALLAGCSTAPTESPVAPARSAATAKPPTPQPTGPEQAVTRYLRWYAAHHNELNPNFLGYSTISDSTKYYAVDLEAAELWLAILRKSNQFSPVYVDNWRDYIQTNAAILRQHPQDDGPPDSFSYDLLMLSQEPDTRLEELQKGIFTTRSVGPGKATVQGRGAQHDGWREGLDFQLSQNAAGRWLIDEISVPDNLTQ